MGERDSEINSYLEHHWHYVAATTDPERPTVTYEICSDPCVRADGSVLILPAVGPVGTEIRRRLTPVDWEAHRLNPDVIRRIATRDLDDQG